MYHIIPIGEDGESYIFEDATREHTVREAMGAACFQTNSDDQRARVIVYSNQELDPLVVELPVLAQVKYVNKGHLKVRLF